MIARNVSVRKHYFGCREPVGRQARHLSRGKKHGIKRGQTKRSSELLVLTETLRFCVTDWIEKVLAAVSRKKPAFFVKSRPIEENCVAVRARRVNAPSRKD